MKALLLNPINLTIILAISVVYLFIVLYLSSRRKNAAVLEKFSISFFLFLLAGSSLFYLPYLNPANFANLGILEGEQKSFIVVQSLIYLVWIAILRASFSGFFANSLLAFRDPFLAGLLILTLLSAFWSETPIVTLIGSVVLVIIALLSAHIAKRFDWSGLASLIRWSLAFIGVLSVPVALLLPSKGAYGGSWNGILLHKNTFGALMALGAVLWYLYAQKKSKNRKFEIAVVLLLSIETFLSTSGGAISILFMLFSVVWVIQVLRKLDDRSRATFIVLLVIFVLPASIALNGSIDSILGLLGKDSNLTGRGDFWPQVISAINNHPLLGYGYMGFWQSWRGNENPARIIRNSNGFSPEHPHNGFLDLGTSLGYVGLALLLLSILKNFSYATVYLNKKQGIESVAPLLLLLYVILRNFSETGLWTTNLDFFFYVLLTIRLNLEMRQPRILTSVKGRVHQNA